MTLVALVTLAAMLAHATAAEAQAHSTLNHYSERHSGHLSTMPEAARLTPSAARVGAALVIDRVMVIDVEHGARLRNQRVVVMGNRIRAIGSRHTVPLPLDAHVIDARGKSLIPGLWDMHYHQYDHQSFIYRLLVANGVTGIRDAGAETPLDSFRVWKREIAAGQRVGPRQVISAQAIDGGPLAPACRRSSGVLHTCIASPADGQHLVDSFKAAGADMIKTYALGSPDFYFAVAGEARRIGLPYGGHLFATDGLTASDSGALILDHETYFTPDVCGDGPRDVRDTNAVQCAAAAIRLRRNNTWLADARAGPRILEIPDSLLTRWSRYARQPLSEAERKQLPSAADWAAWAARTIDSATGRPRGCGRVARVYAANMPVLANTDALIDPGYGIHYYLLLSVLCGAPPLWALQAATLNPALALRMTDSLGSVAVGKVADLVLLDGDPLQDIWNVSKIRAVVANGRYFDRAALDRMLLEADTAEQKWQAAPGR